MTGQLYVVPWSNKENTTNTLIKIIPNEGHEYPHATPKELRIVNQPYIPQNAVVNTGTTVAWLNGDAGHRHSITIVDSKGRMVYTSGFINNATASKSFTFNNTGAFVYSGPSYDKILYQIIDFCNQKLWTPLKNIRPI